MARDGTRWYQHTGRIGPCDSFVLSHPNCPGNRGKLKGVAQPPGGRAGPAVGGCRPALARALRRSPGGRLRISPPRWRARCACCEPPRPNSPGHADEREATYRWVDPGALARSLPDLAEVGGPALVAVMGNPGRFKRGRQFRSFTGLAPKASETGDTDHKGQPMSNAGSSLLRTTLVRAADTAREQDPQLARVYYVQMVERGKDHLGALCVVAANRPSGPGR